MQWAAGGRLVPWAEEVGQGRVCISATSASASGLRLPFGSAFGHKSAGPLPSLPSLSDSNLGELHPLKT